MKWKEAQRVYADATAGFAETAGRIPAARWMTPIGKEKWSPAEIVEHLNLGFEILTAELEGGPGMKIRTKLWQRILLRLWLVPRLLRGGAFPASARSPREMRPAAANPDQTAAMSSFREKAARFETLVARLQAQGGRVRLTHAYFGRAALPESVMLCARHLQHHQRQLT